MSVTEGVKVTETADQKQKPESNQRNLINVWHFYGFVTQSIQALNLRVPLRTLESLNYFTNSSQIDVILKISKWHLKII